MTLLDIVKNGTASQLADCLHLHPVTDLDDVSNALSAAIIQENSTSTALLLKSGAHANCHPSKYMPPLHCAVEQRSRELVQLLCDNGADVNFPNENGFTPLHLAVDVEADTAWQRGEAPNCEFIQFLLSLGANPTAEDTNGSTPVSIAEQYSFDSATELLKNWSST